MYSYPERSCCRDWTLVNSWVNVKWPINTVLINVFPNTKVIQITVQKHTWDRLQAPTNTWRLNFNNVSCPCIHTGFVFSTEQQDAGEKQTVAWLRTAVFILEQGLEVVVNVRICQYCRTYTVYLTSGNSFFFLRRKTAAEVIRVQMGKSDMGCI